MPSRFRPGVLPVDDSGLPEFFEAGVREFRASQERARQRSLQEEDLDHLRGERSRRAVLEDLETRDALEQRGLRPALPRDVARAGEARRSREPDFGPGDVFERPTAERGAELETGPGAFRRELDPTDIRGAFQAQAELGPDARDRPAFLPGQFIPGQGFAPRTIFADEVPDPRVRERLAEPDRVTLGGMEFEQAGPTLSERQRAAFEQEVEALVAAGVSPPQAALAARDPVLARQLVGREGGGAITAEQMEGLGFSPALAQVAAQDPQLARTLIAQSQRPASGESVSERRFEREVMIDAAESYALQLFTRGADLRQVSEALGAVPEFAGVMTPGRLEATQKEAQRLTGRGEVGEATTERRRNIAQVFTRSNRPITEPWHQDVVDMLAGIGPDGGEAEPLSAEEILDGYRRGGATEEQLQEIQRYIPRELR